jgi:copper chaperone
MTIDLTVTGMSCGHCKAAVENALKSVAGVRAVNVDLAGGKAHVEGDAVNTDALVAAVKDEGYTAAVAGV